MSEAQTPTAAPSSKPAQPTPNKYKKPVRGPSQASTTSSSALKKRLRDTERLLKRPNLDATTRKDVERRLKALQLELLEKGRVVEEKKIAAKYKYVRHVEKTKIQRKLKQLEKQEGGASADKVLEQKVRLAYVEHYPRDMKYISLFPSSSSTTDPASDAEEQEKEEKPEGKKRKRQDVKEDGKPLPASVSEYRRDKILDRLKKAIETDEITKKGASFVLRMKDVFGVEDLVKMYAEEKLTKKGRLTMGKEEREEVERWAGVDKAGKSKKAEDAPAKEGEEKKKKEQKAEEEEEQKTKEEEPKAKKPKTAVKKQTQAKKEEEEPANQDANEDDFFLDPSEPTPTAQVFPDDEPIDFTKVEDIHAIPAPKKRRGGKALKKVKQLQKERK
ncbi:18S rRNA maturation protein [Chytridiales sp. JEL 0842]|nr:18S rRNA maturation protein [Chytridiales sp. JEL 0842]